MLFFGPAASFTAHPYLHDKLPYDPRDLAPVARVSATLISLTAPPQLNVNSLGELFAMARATPGKLNWASVTGATDVVIAAFLKREGLDMAKVPYRDPVQALNDVAENRLQFYWSSLAIVRGAIEAAPRQAPGHHLHRALAGGARRADGDPSRIPRAHL